MFREKLSLISVLIGSVEFQSIDSEHSQIEVSMKKLFKSLLVATVLSVLIYILRFKNYQSPQLKFKLPADALRCRNLQLPENSAKAKDRWQKLRASYVDFKLLNAYYDDRVSLASGPVIRVIGLVSEIISETNVFCQMRFEGIEETIVTASYEMKLMWLDNWPINSDGYAPYLISCTNPLVSFNLVPHEVSLAGGPCDAATNNLQIIRNYPESDKKGQIAICVKALNFQDDITMKLVEWMEVIKLLGADKVFFYVVSVHENVMKALRFYEKLRNVKLEFIGTPEGLPATSTQKYQIEVILFNDCLYKHSNEFDYLAPLDIDELILPTRPEDRTWSDLIERFSKNKRHRNKQSFAFRQAYFLSNNNHEGEIQPEAPRDFHFLQSVYMSLPISAEGLTGKSFQSTQRVLLMHNHYPMACVNEENCHRAHIKVENAKLHHYRRGCFQFTEDYCKGLKNTTVKDLTLWKYKDELVTNVRQTLKALESFD